MFNSSVVSSTDDVARESRWMTPTEAAVFLGVTVSTLATWRCRRKGPPWRRIARSCYYVLSECVAWRDAVAHVGGQTTDFVSSASQDDPGAAPGGGNKSLISVRARVAASSEEAGTRGRAK